MKNNLRRIRERLGLSQQEAADRMGISRNAFRKLEDGSTRIINKNVEIFAEAMGVSVDECLFDVSGQTKVESELREEQDANEKLRAAVEYYEKQIEELKASLARREEVIIALHDISKK